MNNIINRSLLVAITILSVIVAFLVYFPAGARFPEGVSVQTEKKGHATTQANKQEALTLKSNDVAEQNVRVVQADEQEMVTVELSDIRAAIKSISNVLVGLEKDNVAKAAPEIVEFGRQFKKTVESWSGTSSINKD